MRELQLIAAHNLSRTRAIEAALGVDTIRALDFTKRGPIVRPFYPHGTRPKLHANILEGMTRGERKRAARARIIAATPASLPGKPASAPVPGRKDDEPPAEKPKRQRKQAA